MVTVSGILMKAIHKYSNNTNIFISNTMGMVSEITSNKGKAPGLKLTQQT